MLDPNNFKGMVEGPGKFEGEPRATEYYWQLAMNGEGESVYPSDDGPEFVYFTVDAEEAAAFGTDAGLEHGDTVVLCEDAAGFVFMLAFATREGADDYVTRWLS